MTSIVVGLNVLGVIWIIFSIIMLIINVINAAGGFDDDKEDTETTDFITALNLVLITGWFVWGFATMLVMGYGVN